MILYDIFKYLNRKQIKKEQNRILKCGFEMGKRLGRQKALEEMVETGQNQYVCKYCKTPVVKSLLDR